MSIINPPKKSAGPTDTPMLEPEQVVDQLRALRQQISEFVQLPNNRELQHMKRLASVNIAFTREAINAVGASETVQNAIGNTPEELHDAENEVSRWTAVEAELRALLRGVIAANLVRRERLGRVALTAYNVSRQLVAEADHANLLPHVEIMRRIPKYERRRVKSTAAPAPPDPAKPKLPTQPTPPAPPTKQ